MRNERAIIASRRLRLPGKLERSAAESLGEDLDDPVAVEAAVLDENRARVATRDCAAGNEEIRDIRFECLRIEFGRERPLVAANAGALHQGDVRTIAGQQQDRVGRDFLAAVRGRLKPPAY